MSEKPTRHTKLYAVSEGKKLSMQDMLDYFAKHGHMRVSDLHLKVGVPPAYRIDGKLKWMNSPPLDQPTMLLLAESVLTEAELKRLEGDRAVDSSCLFGYA